MPSGCEKPGRLFDSKKRNPKRANSKFFIFGREGKKSGGQKSGETNFSSTPKNTQIVQTIDHRTKNPAKDPTLLHQKYVTEGLSPEAIAAQVFSSRKTIVKYLKQQGIPLRDEDQRGTGPLPFGQKWSKLQPAIHQREQETIQKISKLRDEGLSFQKIANVLNAMKVPTRFAGKAKWYGNSVYEVFRRGNLANSKESITSK